MSPENLFYPLKKILLPTDGSEYSIKAAKYCAEIATKHESKVTLLHVLEAFSAKKERLYLGSDLTLVSIAVEDERKIKERGKKIIESTKKIFEETEVPVSVKYFFGGNPARIIVDLAEKKNYDLIVIGHRGIGGVKRLMIGSVTNEVSRMATCPVFIVK